MQFLSNFCYINLNQLTRNSCLMISILWSIFALQWLLSILWVHRGNGKCMFAWNTWSWILFHLLSFPITKYASMHASNRSQLTRIYWKWSAIKIAQLWKLFSYITIRILKNCVSSLLSTYYRGFLFTGTFDLTKAQSL